MLEHFKSKDLKGRVITIVGDIKHSRVFGSLVRIAKKLGAEARLAAPETLIPDQVESFNVTRSYNIEEVLRGADIVYALRVQEERGAKGFIPTLREYSKSFGITEARLALANKNAILMHPGPVIRDIDVHSALVSRHPQARILAQVENGFAVRKAVLWLLAKRMDGREKSYLNL
jgi:aspartate carbamoyltransferase catalytic subunit